mgnify:CR=1 FL=1
MKSTLDQLSAKEREALARLYEMDGYTALKRLCELEILGLGKDALQAPDIGVVNLLQGKAIMAKNIPTIIHNEYKRISKQG